MNGLLVPWLRFGLFSGLALGYAALGFVAGRFLLQSVLEIDLVEYVPMPVLAIQAIGFVLAFVIVVGTTLGLVRLLRLDKM